MNNHHNFVLTADFKRKLETNRGEKSLMDSRIFRSPLQADKHIFKNWDNCSPSLNKRSLLTSALKTHGDRLYPQNWLESAATPVDMGYQVGVQLLALIEGYTVQHPFSGHHRYLTHLPSRTEVVVPRPGIRLHNHNWVSVLAEGEWWSLLHHRSSTEAHHPF